MDEFIGDPCKHVRVQNVIVQSKYTTQLIITLICLTVSWTCEILYTRLRSGFGIFQILCQLKLQRSRFYQI